jgi:hypothetical protein
MKIGCLILFVFIIPHFFYATSLNQSTPNSAETVSPSIFNKKSKDVQSSDLELYKLIFPTGYEGKLKVKYDDVDRNRQLKYKNFVAQLNQAGAQGYKLAIVIKGYPFAVMKLDEGQYEYASFETESGLFFAKGGFSEKFAEYARQGFRLINHMQVGATYTTEGSVSYGAGGVIDKSGQSERVTYNDAYLLEREKGVNRPVEYMLAASGPTWRARMDEELTGQVKEQMSRGLYPTTAFSRYEVLLQQPEKSENITTESLEIRIVTKPNIKSGGAEKKINELAQQNFRLASVSRDIGIMYRNSETREPLSYVWLNASKKDFDKQLAKVQAAGAAFRMTYPDGWGEAKYLIFEQPIGKRAETHEYRVIKLSLQRTEDAALNQVLTTFTASSIKAIEEMNYLIKQGFRIRGVFGMIEPKILLER